MMKKRLSLSIVIPAYNEEDNIQEAVESAVFEAGKITPDYEIIVVNDGSVDKTGQVLDKLKKRFPKLKVYTHAQNLGIEPSLKDLYSYANKELTFFNGADNEIKMSILPALLSKMGQGFDIVVAQRISKDYHLFRKVLSWGFNFLVKLLFGIEAFDAGCAKLIKTQIYKKMSVNSSSPFGEAERLIKAYRQGFKISSVPVNHFRGEKVSSIRFKHITHSLKDLFRMLLSR